MFKKPIIIGSLFLSAACAQPPQSQDFSATYTNMSAEKFDVEATAPPQIIREYTICKGIRFAEKQKAEKVSFSNPAYGEPKASPMMTQSPKDWVSIKATVYISGQNPDGNSYVVVAERAKECRQFWNWYR